MRVPTLNYSTLGQAINSKYAAESGQYVNKGIGIATEGVDIAKKSAELSKKSLEQNRQYQKTQEGLQIASAVVQGVSALNDLGKSIYSVVEAKQQEESKTQLFDFQTASDQALKDSVAAGNTFIDADGNVQYGEDYRNFCDNYYSSIDNQKWGKTIKSEHLMQAKALGSNPDNQARAYIANRASGELNQAYQNNLNIAQNIDLGNFSFDQLQVGVPESQRYAAGYAEIDSQVASGTMSQGLAEVEKARYKRQVDNATGEAVMSAVARQGGDREAVRKWLSENYGLTDSELNKINNVADNSEKNYIQDSLIPNATKVIDTAYNSFGTDQQASPKDAIDSVKVEMKTAGQSQDHIDQVVNAMKVEFNTRATEDLNKLLSGHSDMTSAELVVLKGEVESRKDFLSGGAESAYNTALNTINTDLEIIDKAQVKAAEKKATSIKNYLATSSAEIEALTVQVTDGSITGYDAISYIRSVQTEVSNAFTDDDLEYLRTNAPDVYKDLTSFDTKAIKACNAIKDAIVPAEYKNMFSTFLTDVEKLLKNTYGEDIYGVGVAKTNMEGSLIDLMLETKSGEIDPKVVQTRLNDIKNLYVGKVYSQLSNSTIGGGVVAQNTIKQSLNTLNNFVANPGAAYTMADNGHGESSVEWIDQKFGEAFNQAAFTLRDKLSKALGSAKLQVDIQTETRGSSEIPVAYFRNTETGETYQILSNGAVYQKDPGNKKDIYTGINLIDLQSELSETRTTSNLTRNRKHN